MATVPRADVPAPGDVARLTRRGLRLAQFTVAYNVGEGIIAVASGLSAGLVSLVGFGLDSAIESTVAVLVALRLSARLRHGHTDETKERRTLHAVAVTFYLLAGFMIIEGTRALLTADTPEQSPVGIVLLVASIVVMPGLALAKRRVAHELGGDPLILADAAETLICVLLSISTLTGLILFQLTGATWLDPVAGFIIAAFAIHEGREAWEGELVEDDD
jgi:divalent metal cation (Fe/Co/Zn/Cd) transporter